MKTSLLKLKVKKELISYLTILFESLEEWEKSTKQEYVEIDDTDEQAVDWKTKEPRWADEEHTIPIYKKEWGYVDKKNLDEDDEAKIEAINQIRTALEKLV